MGPVKPQPIADKQGIAKMAKDDIKREEEGEILDDVLSDEEVKVETKEPKEKQVVEEGLATTTTTTTAAAAAIAATEPTGATTQDKTNASREETEPAKIEPATKEAPPPKPARPLTPRQEAIKALKEAFPTVEDKYITSHLIASRFQLETAFNALLYLSDPESVNLDEVAEEPAPPTLPRRVQQSQLEQDELLAKQLDEEYRSKADRLHKRQQGMRRQRTEGSSVAEDDEDDVLSTFIDKDLPQLKEQFTKNVEETKNKFNSWVSGWKQQYSQSQQELNNRQIKRQVRDEFDAEPEEVDLQKFHGIKLSDDTEPIVGRNRALSTDLYGTPKHKPRPVEKDSKPKPDEDDDFNLSDA